MRRIQLVVAIAAILVISAISSVPAMAKTDLEDIRGDQAELIEDRLEDRGYDVGDLDGEDLGWYWGTYDFGLLYYLD